MDSNSGLTSDIPPRRPAMLRMLMLTIFVLVVYFVIGTFNDPFPYPVREIAGGVLIVLMLVGHIWRWVCWFGSTGRRSPLIRRAIWSIVTLVFVYTIFRETYFDPLPGATGSLLALSLFPVVLGLIIRSIATNPDEVERTAAFEGFSWGALVGLGCIYAGVIAIRWLPGMSDWLQATAEGMTGPLSPAAIGFGFGASFSLIVVWISLFVSRALWWRRRA